MSKILQFKPRAVTQPPAPRVEPTPRQDDNDPGARYLLTDVLLAVAYYAYAGDVRSANKLNNAVKNAGFPTGISLSPELESLLKAANLEEAYVGPEGFGE